MKLKATVRYLDLEGGFWGLIDQDNNKFRVINMPEQLKKDGAIVNVTIKPVNEDASIQMWGQAVKITGFHTLSPV